MGVDIGGTTLSAGLVSFQGDEVRGFRTAPTRKEEGPRAVVERVGRLAAAAMTETSGDDGGGGEVVGMGVGSPGPLDRSRGVVVETPNLGWRDVPLLDLLSREIGLPTTLDNDGNCAAYGEWWMGAGQGTASLVALTLGTGVGGGVVLEGDVLHGASDVAGEVGHMTVQLDGRRCGCGNRGCLEAYASGPSIASRAVEELEDGGRSLLLELAEGDRTRVTAETVADAARKGDAHARKIFLETAEILGAGIGTLLNVLNPGMVVIGGGVARAGDLLFDPLREAVRRRAFSAAVEACRIVPAALGEKAGVVGAAGIFRTSLGGSP